MADHDDSTPVPTKKFRKGMSIADAAEFNETWASLFGANARMAALTTTRTQDELRSGFKDEPEALLDLLDELSTFSEQCKAVQKIADAAFARLMIVGNEICETPA